MAGLIEDELDLLKTKAAPGPDEVAISGGTGYDAATREIDPAKETVSGQLDAVLAKDSLLMQRARAGAQQTANRRGLLNSSMAAGAGEAAAIDAAFPIASADASIYGTAARDNQAFTNQSRQFGAGEANTTARLNTEALNRSGQAKLAAELEKGLIGSRLGAESQLQAERAGQEATLIGTRAGAESTLQAERAGQEKELTQLRGTLDTQLQELRGDQAKSLADIEAGYKQLIQASSSASGFYSDVVKMMAAIMADVNTSTEQKQSAVDRMSSMLQSGLTIIGGIADLDLASLLDFTTPEAAAEGA
jgi:hypothetical protein